MKTLQLVVLSVIAILLTFSAVAQAKTDTFHVSGECNMCKKKIETAAKVAGATYASWNVDSKTLTVKYNSESANAAKIQQRIAEAGYDTPGAKASDSAYNNLDDCCKYDRGTSSATKEACCSAAAGNCANDAACCAKDSTCCKDGKCMHDSIKATSMKTGAGSCCAKL
jgi:copper chaperone CopZ